MDTRRRAAVQSVLAATANPEYLNQVDVSQPSAALVARADAQGAFDSLFLGLGAVATLVGAVGVANIMIISVLERRSEIALRRALGPRRATSRIQFLSEAVLLALLGGAVGVGLGVLSTRRLRLHQGLDCCRATLRLDRWPRCSVGHRSGRRTRTGTPRRPNVARPKHCGPCSAEAWVLTPHELLDRLELEVRPGNEPATGLPT